MAEDVLLKSVQAGNRGRKRLKKFGKATKLNYRTCRLCLKHWKHYNKPESMDYSAVLFDELKDYGCTPLHAWMRVMECFLKAGESKLMSLRGLTHKEARKNIQERFASQEGRGLRVFFPNPKGGNSNCGPTARRFFENHEITATILDCPQESVDFFYYLSIGLKLRVICTHQKIPHTGEKESLDRCGW